MIVSRKRAEVHRSEAGAAHDGAIVEASADRSITVAQARAKFDRAVAEARVSSIYLITLQNAWFSTRLTRLKNKKQSQVRYDDIVRNADARYSKAVELADEQFAPALHALVETESALHDAVSDYDQIAARLRELEVLVSQKCFQKIKGCLLFGFMILSN